MTGPTRPRLQSARLQLEDEFTELDSYRPVRASSTTQDQCRRTLGEAIRSVSGKGGALFAPTGLSGLEYIVELPNGGASRGHRLDLVAGAALRAGHPVTSSESDGARGTSREQLAVPCQLDGQITAVVAIDGIAPDAGGTGERMVQLEPYLLAVALLIDRLRMQKALEERVDEISALRKQLDAFAHDFRLTYSEEQKRSAQLAEALIELEETYESTVRGLAIAVEAKDECTGGHLVRVSRYGMLLTSLIAPDHANDIQFQYGFFLHDVGKLTVPDVVLSKAGPLTEAEWEIMRNHPAAGRAILDGIPFLAGAREIVYAHHERWDGKGYPNGLAGEEIPLGAQIFPLCDAFDAMTSDRPYRKALSIDAARSELIEGRGTQFRPDVVDAFLTVDAAELDNVRGTSSSEAI
jgi:HD-GYP domain-containing protein (c-di-GMP phosphodiesterase class II)